MPSLSIIILNWNGWENTLGCLESLYDISYPNYRVILVDNGSTNRSVEIIKNWVDQKKRNPSYSRIKTSFIINKKNEGFVGGNNIAIKQILREGKSDYILLLNNDTIVDRDFLTGLIKIADSDKGIGIVGPKIYYHDFKGKKNVIQSAGATINLYTGVATWYGEKKIDRRQFEKIRTVGYITGACLLIKCEAIKKIGILNDKLFAYFEDVDWCLRAKEKGYDVVYAPGSTIWHKGGETSKNIPELSMYYRVRNRFLIEKRFAKNYQYIFFIGYYLLVMIPLWTFRCFIFLKRPGLMKYFFQGLRDGLTQQ